MESAKERMERMIRSQPDDATYDEILKELAFEGMIERGLDDHRSARTISDDEMRERISKWPK